MKTDTYRKSMENSLDRDGELGEPRYELKAAATGTSCEVEGSKAKASALWSLRHRMNDGAYLS